MSECRNRPLTLTLLSLFYAVAAVAGVVGVALLLTGNEIPLIPFDIGLPMLAMEMVLFGFLAYGLRKGWRLAWAAALIANIAWLFMDFPNLLSGNLSYAAPVLIAAVSLLFLLVPDSRRFCRICRNG